MCSYGLLDVPPYQETRSVFLQPFTFAEEKWGTGLYMDKMCGMLYAYKIHVLLSIIKHNRSIYNNDTLEYITKTHIKRRAWI